MHGPAPGFQLRGGTIFAIAGTAFSVWLLATRSSSQLWIMIGIIAAGVILRGVSRQGPGGRRGSPRLEAQRDPQAAAPISRVYKDE
jgi:hypothetical protein